MFSFIADVSLAEYIRRRRLTQAGFDLQKTDSTVLDIALKYGYDSPISFSRAFQNLHGLPPSEARKKGSSLKSYPKISFKITIKGVKSLG
jgi:AraC family transcriptional regulator